MKQTRCTAITAKGTRCTYPVTGCVNGKAVCGLHQRMVYQRKRKVQYQEWKRLGDEAKKKVGKR